LGEYIFGASPRQARFFQLRVSNSGRFGRAHRVYVWLLAVDYIEEQHGGSVRTWAGELPLVWQHKDYLPGPREIGDPANADIFAVFEDGELTLFPLIPALALQTAYKVKCKLILTVQARSDETRSPETRILVAWDGTSGKDSRVVFKIMLATDTQSPMAGVGVPRRA
jgi:hypothetical protein